MPAGGHTAETCGTNPKRRPSLPAAKYTAATATMLATTATMRATTATMLAI